MPVGVLELATGAHLELSLADVDPLFADMACVRLRAWLSSLVAGTYAALQSRGRTPAPPKRASRSGQRQALHR